MLTDPASKIAHQGQIVGIVTAVAALSATMKYFGYFTTGVISWHVDAAVATALLLRALYLTTRLRRISTSMNTERPISAHPSASAPPKTPEVDLRLLRDQFSDEQIEAAEDLIRVINADPAIATQQLNAFRSKLDEREEEVGDFEFHNLIGDIAEIADWKSSFHVDWKDTDSFVECIKKLASAWGINVNLETSSNDEVPDLMKKAHQQLQTHGFTLWSWDTGGDCYSGWITRFSSNDTVAHASKVLETEVRVGDSSF